MGALGGRMQDETSFHSCLLATDQTRPRPLQPPGPGKITTGALGSPEASSVQPPSTLSSPLQGHKQNPRSILGQD